MGKREWLHELQDYLQLRGDVMSEIYTKRGKLSAYGFACGYVERKETPFKRVTLSKEHNTYIVGASYKQTLDYYMQGFDTLAKARKLFNSL